MKLNDVVSKKPKKRLKIISLSTLYILFIPPSFSLAQIPIKEPYLYRGVCDCPYDLAYDGSICGGRSAYARSGGRTPICYEHDFLSYKPYYNLPPKKSFSLLSFIRKTIDVVIFIFLIIGLLAWFLGDKNNNK